MKIIFSDPVLNEEGGKKITHVERWFSVSASWALPSRHLGVLLTTFLESILAAFGKADDVCTVHSRGHKQFMYTL